MIKAVSGSDTPRDQREQESIMSQRKHPDQRHGHRSREELRHDTVEPGADLTWAPADPKWHPIAARLYRSVQVSGQVSAMQQTDVEVAWLLCDQVAIQLRSRGPIGATAFQSIMGACNDLLMTAGSRRAAKLELARGDREQAEAVSAAVVSLAGRRPRTGPAGEGA